MEIEIKSGLLRFREQNEAIKTFSILNKNSVSVYSGFFNKKNLKYFYYFKKIGIKNIIFDLKLTSKNVIIQRISRFVSLNIIDSKIEDINIEEYVEKNLEISRYKSTNGSDMSLCELDISKLKLTYLKR